MINKARRTLVLQHDTSDCGVSCMLSIIRYFGGDNNLENLRRISGTDSEGTTLLGLLQCTNEIGLISEAFEAEIEHLKDLKDLGILHVTLENGLQHFVVIYSFDRQKNNFIIGNPATGIELWTEDTLLNYWKSKVILTVKTGDNFIKREQERVKKRKWFISLVKDDLNILVTASFVGLIIAALGLSTALYTQKLIDEIIPKHQISRLIGGLILLFILLIAKSGISFLRQHFLLIQGKDFNERITGNFASKLMHLPKLFFDSRKTGDLIARLNDIVRIQRSIAHLSGVFIIDLLIIIISSAYLFSFHYTIAFVTLSSLPLMGLISWNYNNVIIQNNKDVMAGYAVNESNYIDTIDGISDIKASNSEERFIEKMRHSFNLFQNKVFNLGKTSNQFNFIVEIAANVIILALIALVSYFTLQKQLKIGEMMAVLSVAIGLLPSCTRLMLTNLQIQEAIVAFDRMYEFTSTHSECDSDITETSSWDYNFEQLEVKQLSFRFAGRSCLLNNANLLIRKGCVTVLFGESGSGKSTLIQILQRFYDPEAGDITINGNINLHDIPIKNWRNTVTVLPQDVKIFNFSIIQNICMSTDQTDFKTVVEICQIHGLLNYFNQFPQGIFTQVGEDKLKLSGGQKQIIGLLRALFRKPQLLLLDEPTASLDPNTELFILNLLAKLKKEMGILLISHKTSASSIADFQYKIEKGMMNIIENVISRDDKVILESNIEMGNSFN